MSDNENSTENVEQYTDEVNNIDNSNKRRHEEEETGRTQEEKVVCTPRDSSQKHRMRATT